MTPVRIAMWSGPRNISTAMMRAFENRADTAVVDEPFYAPYLKRTGIDHPLREKTLASHENDWRIVVHLLTGPVPGDREIFYQKHMTHHMLPEFDLDWMKECRSAFLVRAPEAVLASYTARRAEFLPQDVGFARQYELFERECDRLGRAPPVVDAEDVLRDPPSTLNGLCHALGIAFSEDMLHWPAGPRATDGVWAPAWYDSVERSSGFAKPRTYSPLDDDLKAVADSLRPYYQRLTRFKLSS
jgi:sulfotransferase family protein